MGLGVGYYDRSSALIRPYRAGQPPVPPDVDETSYRLVRADTLTGVSGLTVTGGLAGPVVLPERNIRQVVFSVDGLQVRTETQAPYSLSGDSGGAVASWDSSTVSNGPHTLSADVTLIDGRVLSTSASINVDNTATPTGPPAAPSGLLLTASGSGYIVTAPRVAGATSYNLWEDTRLVVAGSTSPSFTRTGLAAGRTYTVQMNASNAAGQSPLSAALTVSPGGLPYRPPALTAPTTVAVPVSGGTVTLDPARDYIVRLPATTVSGSVLIDGGRNVVLIGGQINGNGGARGLFLRGQRGTAFVEGVRLSPVSNGDGINLDQRYGSTVIIQNCWVERVTGTQAGVHADGLQSWAGPDRLYVHGLHITSNYQGILFHPNDGNFGGASRPYPSEFAFSAVHINDHEGVLDYALWQSISPSYTAASPPYPVRVSDVTVRHAADRAQLLKSWDGKPGSTWADVRIVTTDQRVWVGTSDPGLAYTSPGYL